MLVFLFLLGLERSIEAQNTGTLRGKREPKKGGRGLATTEDFIY